MTSIKQVVLTAIHNKGIEVVKKEVSKLADGLLCTESSVKRIIRQYETGKIVIL